MDGQMTGPENEEGQPGASVEDWAGLVLEPGCHPGISLTNRFRGAAGGPSALSKPVPSTPSVADFQPTHRWWWRAKLGERNGEPCAVLARGRMNSILVSFADGHRVLTSRHAVRRL